MNLRSKLIYTLGAVLVSSLGIHQASALSITQQGTFGADDQIYSFLFTLPTAQNLTFSTTSYGGGTNADGTATPAGGFVPVLTLFSVATTNVIQCEGAGSACTGAVQVNPNAHIDPTTSMADDAYMRLNLNAGSYLLQLSEFPNVASGNFNTPYLFAGQSTVTGDFCGVPGGTFLQVDTASCAQRTGNYSLNITDVPEPATLWLSLPILAFGLLRRKRIQPNS